SEPATAPVTIEYPPRLPKLVLLPLPGGTVLFEGKDPREVQLKGRLLPPADPHPFDAVVVREDDKKIFPVEIDSKTGTFTAQVPLRNGENRLEVRLSNRWKAVTAVATQVSYRRPPRFVAPLQASEPGQTPLIDITARVESAADLPLTRAENNGRGLTAGALGGGETQDGVTAWTVRARKVPLEQGKNVLRLLVSNADGPCLEPRTLEIRFQPPPPPRAVVEFLDPARDATVETAHCPCRFRVRS